MPEAYAASIERLRALAGTSRDPDGRVLAVVAEYLRRDGRLAEAGSAAQELIARLPEFASAHVVWAQVQTDQGDLEGARATVARLLELDRHNARAIEITQSLDVADEAAALDWARAQGVGPAVEVEDEVVTVTLGELYLEQGAVGRAAEVARQLLELDGSNEQARTLLDRATASGSTVAVEQLAPEPTDEPEVEAVPVADLAPDAVPVEELAPDAVPIASLAPDAVPVADLAPDPIGVTDLVPEPVGVADLAPEPVAVADLAPPISDVASLAPEPTPAEASSADPVENAEPASDKSDDDLDDFMSWLDEN